MANFKFKLVTSHLYQLFLHEDGAVETSKLFMIEIILFHLKKKTFQYYKTNLVLQIALTKVVVFNIYGKTLHQLLYFLI